MSLNLDNNATTQPAPEVIEAMSDCLQHGWGNPSSAHRRGIDARRRLELAREEVAGLIGCEEREIVLTSGGTEGANLAIIGGFQGVRSAQPDRSLLVCPMTEHPAVLDAMQACTGEGGTVQALDVDPDGVIDMEAFERLIESRGEEIALCSVMWVNNETGVIQPIERIGALCREHGILFHSDAVQWVGRESCDFASAPVDLLSCSAHKFHGPKGVGALVVRDGVRIAPRMLGGPQERQRRGGTENVPAIAGFGVACSLAGSWIAGNERDTMSERRDRFESLLKSELDGVQVNAEGAPRTWNTSNIAFSGIQAQLLVVVLSEHGLAVSGGAACASGSIETSPVLGAMGISPESAAASIRFSLSRWTTEEEIRDAAAITIAAVNAAREG